MSAGVAEHGSDSLAASSPREAFGARLLGAPRVRLALLLPVTCGVGFALVRGRIAEPGLFVALTALVTVLAAVPALRPWGGDPAVDPVARRREERWQLLSLVLGMGALAPYLVVAVDVSVDVFAGVIALVLVMGAFAFPERRRIAMFAWIIVVWVATLWWSGTREPAVLLLHVGGAVLVAAVAVRSASVLIDGYVREASARRAAERRAQLLASLLRTNTLDPEDVLRATVDGLLAVGFDLAAIRRLDPDDGVARLIEGASRRDVSVVEDWPLSGSEHAQVLATGEPLLRHGAEAVPGATVDQAVRDVLLLPLHHHGRVDAAVTAATSDEVITEEHRAAAELLAEQAQAALERAAAYRADERTVEELRRLDARTQDFVATVSHELRTPLTVVHGVGQTLLAYWDELPVERRRDLLTRIDANTERLGTMLSSLLDTSAFEGGQLRPSPSPVGLRALLASVLHRLASMLRAHDVILDMDPGLLAHVDESLLEHVIENLLGNAAKHTPAGTRVEVAAVRRADRIEVTVTDDGPGIGEEDLPHVLERFYRGGSPTSRVSAGLGLGLALARSVVAAHGGELRVHSVPGRGTTFSFDVPGSAPGEDGADAPAPR